MNRQRRSLHRMTVAVVLSSLTLTGLLANATEAREKIGLVLAGGGARGIAHAGVIQALEEMQIPVDAIAGTSMGALVGGLYASGKDGQQLREIVETLEWEEAFKDRVDRSELTPRRKSDDYDYPADVGLNFTDGELTVPLGLIQGQQVRQIIKELMKDVGHLRDFDTLPIPFRAVATDIESGDAYVFSEGSIVTAMRASMSLPGLLAPVPHGDRLLVDGGLAMNIPVTVGQSMGVDRLIVVDIGTPLKTRDEIGSFLAVADQMLGFLTRKNSLEQLELMNEGDILLRPDLDGSSMMAFEASQAIWQAGYDTTIAMRTELAQLSLPDEAWVAYKQQRNTPPLFSGDIEYIAVNDDSALREDIIQVRISQPLGEALDRPQLQKDLATIYALGYWELIDYELVSDERGDGLQINAVAKRSDEGRLKLGLSLATDLDGSNELNIGTSYLLKGVNDMGGEVYARAQLGEEVLLGGQFYQPLDVRSRFFAVPALGYRNHKVNTFGPEWDSTALIGAWRVKELTADLALGTDIGGNTQLRLGLFRGQGEFEIDSTTSDLLPEDDFDRGAGYLALRYDTLDDAFFATSGLFLYGDYQVHDEDLGSPEDFERLELIGQGALTFGATDANTLIFTGRAGVSRDAPNQPQNYFQLGGLFNLSGVQQDFFSGRQMVFGMAQYQRKLTRSGVLPFDLPAYVGASLEAGNLWQDHADIDLGDMVVAGSVYFAVNSPLGPLYLAYGRNQDEFDAVYLSIGWPFLSQRARIGR